MTLTLQEIAEARVAIAVDKDLDSATIRASMLTDLLDIAERFARIAAIIEPLRALEAAATKGPWKWAMEDSTVLALYGPDEDMDHVLWSQICRACAERGGQCTSANQRDQDIIAAARNALPALLREIQETPQ